MKGNKKTIRYKGYRVIIFSERPCVFTYYIVSQFGENANEKNPRFTNYKHAMNAAKIEVDNMEAKYQRL